jgi:hypothetical protein
MLLPANKSRSEEVPKVGSIPLEDLDVVIDPKQQRLMVNPRSPDIATKYAK